MNKELLAIDDEPAFLAVIQMAAEPLGLVVTATTEAEVFRTRVRNSPPDIILLDLQMPNCDGIELLRFLADGKCRAKIVLMSGIEGRVLSLARGMGQELGLDMGDSLQKPVRVADLRKLFGSLRGRSFEADGPALRQALDEKRLELYYQPLVKLDDGSTVGFEALVRWNHPEYGLIMPDRFIGLAERVGLIDPLTQRVTELAIEQLAAWRRDGFKPFVSINLSAMNLADARLPDHLFKLCAQHAIPPDRICLELTETAAMGNPTLMLEILTRLRLKGFRLAVDDFGTGYSSLLQLHRLPFSELKIDQSFVREMAHSDEARLIVGLIAGLGKGLRLELIAEGVETADLMKQLIEFGCEMGQGYYFNRPMLASQVLGWLSRH